MKNALIIFVKQPFKGQVKTRLAATLGDDRALEIYRELLRITAETTAKITDCADLHLFHTPFIPTSDFWDKTACKRHLQQSAGDLGERMYAAFQTVFDLGYEKAAIIGSDIPAITPPLLRSAFEALNDREIVIGPAEDGGFYLLGARGPDHLDFSGIKWSTEKVLECFTGNLARKQVRPILLKKLEDIDDEGSYHRFQLQRTT